MHEYQELLGLIKEIEAYNYILRLYYYDSATIAPEKGKEYGAKMTNILKEKLHLLNTNPRLLELMEIVVKQDLPKDIIKELELTIKNLKKEIVVDACLNNELNKAQHDSLSAWEKAREAKDFNIFKDKFKKVVDLKKQAILKRNSNKSIYDEMLSDYVDGNSIEEYDRFFDLIKTKIVPIVKQLKNRQSKVFDSFLSRKISIDKQKRVVEIIKEYFNFKDDIGYISESIHPFSIMIAPSDIRITTAYKEDKLMTSILALIHEIGHAKYSHNVVYPFEGSQKEALISMAMHESQSHFLEDFIGRERNFWLYMYPKLQTICEEFKDISLDNFIQALTNAKADLIRMDADQLTYPIHILIRYEIEKEFINNNYNFDELANLWNQKYQEYLGITPKNDLEGILQDSHWTDTYGYFPAYALGCAISAQIYHYLKENFNFEEKLVNGNFNEIEAWLKENIHQYGGLLNYNEILLKATKEPFNPNYYINYLISKYQ